MSLSRRLIPYSAELWARLGPIWRDISSASSEISVFLSPDWTEVWLQHFGDTVRPSGLVWTIGDGTPVGCALYSQQTAKLGPFNVTRLFVNACGDHLTGMEYNEIPALPGYRDAVLSDFVAYVLESGADELALTGFKSEIAATICEKWPSRSCEGYVSESPFVALNRLREEKRHYLESLSANTRSNVRRTLRAYTNHYGEPTLRRAADSNEAISWFEQMVKLHDARWKDKGKPGAFSGAHVNSFYKNLIRSSVENADGMTRMRLDLLRLQFGELATGFAFNLVYRGRVNFYQCGLAYQPHDNKLRPGLALHTLSIEHYLTEGTTLEYDFLGGEPESIQYKRSLSTDVRQLAWFELPLPTAKNAFVRWVRHSRRKLRSLTRRSESKDS